MTAAMGTLAFLATLWLLVVVGASILEENCAKIASALKGEPVRKSAPGVTIRLSMRPSMNQPRRACAQLRAAA
jgi:hypothetical protein